MPLWGGTGTPGDVEVTPTPTREFRYSYMAWYDPTGREWPLTNRALNYWCADLDGEQSAPVQLTTDDQPRGGASVRNVAYLPRTITVTLAVVPDDPEDFRGMWDDLEDAFSRSTEEGMGLFLIAHPDGRRRAIRGQFSGWTPGAGDRWSWGVVALSLFCPDPFWFDPDPVTITKSYSAAGSSFLAPYPRVSSGATLGASTLTNEGEVVAWPRWTLSGPFSSFQADNNSTGQTFTVTPSSALVAGEQRIIETLPPTIVDETGAGALGDLVLPGSTLWGLQRGDNLVDFVATGSGTGTSIVCEYLRRYKRP